MHKKNWLLIVYVLLSASLIAGEQPATAVVVPKPMVKRRLPAWKKWLIGGSVATAALITALLAWRSRGSDADQKPAVQPDGLLLAGMPKPAPVAPVGVASPLAGPVPVPLPETQRTLHLAGDYLELETGMPAELMAASKNQALTRLIKKLYQSQVDQKVLDNAMVFVSNTSKLSQPDRVVVAKKLLMQRKDIFYLPYQVEEVKVFNGDYECPICEETASVFYLFETVALQHVCAYCSTCWDKGKERWEPGTCPHRIQIRNMVIAVKQGFYVDYESIVRQQEECLLFFTQALQSASERMKDFEKCSCAKRGDFGCACSVYAARRTQFTPADYLQEAVVLGSLPKSSSKTDQLTALATSFTFHGGGL